MAPPLPGEHCTSSLQKSSSNGVNPNPKSSSPRLCSEELSSSLSLITIDMLIIDTGGEAIDGRVFFGTGEATKASHPLTELLECRETMSSSSRLAMSKETSASFMDALLLPLKLLSSSIRSKSELLMDSMEGEREIVAVVRSDIVIVKVMRY